MKVLITGLNGFIGHHVASMLLDETDWEIVGLDRIDATSTLHRLRDIPHWKEHASRVKFVWHDLRAAINPTIAAAIGPIDVVIHMAASTHVDRSIQDPMSFVMDNVVGTTNLLEWLRSQSRGVLAPNLFINFGTDEVFGPAPPGTAYKEEDRLNSGNPYAATKAGAEQLALAYANTYGLPILLTRTMNVIGERQHPEKYLPKVIRSILKGEVVTIHSDPALTKAGSRFYLYARNVGQALKFLIGEWTEGHVKRGEKFHIVGEREVDNLELAQMVASRIGKNLEYQLVDAHSSRPGHDLRYALSGEKLQQMGFRFPMNLDQTLDTIVEWYLENPDWLL